MDMDTQLMDITERDLLMLSQRLMLTMDMVLDTALLDMVTDHMDTQLMDIMERDLLMLSQRLMLTMDMVLDTALLDMVTDHMDIQLMGIMERDPLMLSQRRCLLRIRSWIQYPWIRLQIIWIPSLWCLWTCLGISYMQHSKKLKSKQSKSMALSSQKIIRNYCWCRNL